MHRWRKPAGCNDAPTWIGRLCAGVPVAWTDFGRSGTATVRETSPAGGCNGQWARADLSVAAGARRRAPQRNQERDDPCSKVPGRAIREGVPGRDPWTARPVEIRRIVQGATRPRTQLGGSANRGLCDNARSVTATRVSGGRTGDAPPACPGHRSGRASSRRPSGERKRPGKGRPRPPCQLPCAVRESGRRGTCIILRTCRTASSRC